MSDSDGNRAYVITSTDRRGLVVIASTILMSWMVLCFCIRLYTRIGITGSFKLDDFFAGLGTVREIEEFENGLHPLLTGLFFSLLGDWCCAGRSYLEIRRAWVRNIE